MALLSAGVLGYVGGMKAIQVVLFIIGGCLAIYAGMDNGYAVAMCGVLFAFIGSVIVPEAYASIMPKKSGSGSGKSG